MTADTTAATGTADPSPATATTTATTDATNATTPAGSQATPPEGGDTTAATTDGSTTAAVPEAYTFAMPEGMTLDQGLADAVTPILREANISQEVAQKLADAFAERMKAAEAGAGDAFDKAYEERQKAETAAEWAQWTKQLQADPEIGGNNSAAIKSRVIDAIGVVATPEIKAAFNDLGWGNHPEMVRLVHRLIDYTPPEKGERAAGAGGTGSKTPEAVLWPDLPAR